jgi:DNA (cytosine-5)-methyltransferase 1
VQYLSLFSGIGGLDLAAHWVGFRPAAFVERDGFCQKVLAKHWHGTPIFDDVRTFNAAQFLGISLIIGGFPCQDISAAGKGAGLEGERSGLWFEYLRIIKECRPRFVVAENVDSLLGRGLDRVLCGLEEAGYAVEALSVAASDMGAPHQRKRWFIVGERIDQPGVAQGDSCGGRLPGKPRRGAGSEPTDGLVGGEKRAMANPDGQRQSQSGGIVADFRRWNQHGGQELADPLGHGWQEQRGDWSGGEFLSPSGTCGGGSTVSRMGGAAHGLSGGMDFPGLLWPAGKGTYQHDWEAPRTVKGKQPGRPARIQALGNAVVPAQALPVMLAVAERLRGVS